MQYINNVHRSTASTSRISIMDNDEGRRGLSKGRTIPSHESQIEECSKQRRYTLREDLRYSIEITVDFGSLSIDKCAVLCVYFPHCGSSIDPPCAVRVSICVYVH